MVLARSFDPVADEAVALGEVDESSLTELLVWISQRPSGRGLPAIEFLRPDGSALTLGTDGTRVSLAWVDSLGASYSCVGDQEGEHLVFDYFGSWTEVAAANTLPLEVALECIRRFLDTGLPETESVLFEGA